METGTPDDALMSTRMLTPDSTRACFSINMFLDVDHTAIQRSASSHTRAATAVGSIRQPGFGLGFQEGRQALGRIQGANCRRCRWGFVFGLILWAALHSLQNMTVAHTCGVPPKFALKLGDPHSCVITLMAHGLTSGLRPSQDALQREEERKLVQEPLAQEPNGAGQEKYRLPCLHLHCSLDRVGGSPDGSTQRWRVHDAFLHISFQHDKAGLSQPLSLLVLVSFIYIVPFNYKLVTCCKGAGRSNYVGLSDGFPLSPFKGQLTPTQRKLALDGQPNGDAPNRPFRRHRAGMLSLPQSSPLALGRPPPKNPKVILSFLRYLAYLQQKKFQQQQQRQQLLCRVRAKPQTAEKAEKAGPGPSLRPGAFHHSLARASRFMNWLIWDLDPQACGFPCQGGNGTFKEEKNKKQHTHMCRGSGG